MSKLSVIIPSRGERFLQQTVTDVLTKARGEVECIVVLEGWWPNPPLINYNNQIILHRGVAQGLRAAVNSAAAIATGQYLLKADSHCLFAEGYDEVLKADCNDNWLVVPSRYSLDAEHWCIAENGKARVDYHYLSYPYIPGDDRAGLHGVQWNERRRERKEFDIDEEMSSQGSCWFMPHKHFDRLGGMDEERYGGFYHEVQELGLKTWLGGGKMMVNKKTYYAHLFKGKQYGRGYSLPGGERQKYSVIFTDYWMHNQWSGQVHNMQWLLERFWQQSGPIPTWPLDILENWGKYVPERK